MPTTLPPAYAVLGIIGPDSATHREVLRQWSRPVAPSVLVRFAVSLRDRAARPWWEANSRAPAEPDVDFLDCLGQRSGAGVVILALFDAWLRHAVARYPTATFIGRADSDAIPSPSWLLAMLEGEQARQTKLLLRAAAEARSVSPPLVYAGSFQWYHWDTLRFRPWGWGNGPRNSRIRAVGENPQMCRSNNHPRCEGPFTFAAGPLLLLSSSLARWYVHSATAASAVAAALDSRLNRTTDGGGGDGTRGSSKRPASLADARARGRFLELADAGDLDVRLFDDIFLGHALCLGGAPNVTLLAFPHGLLADFPCVGGLNGCRNGLDRQFNWTATGAPLVAHRIRKPDAVPLALERLRAAPFVVPHLATCAPLQPDHYELVWGHGWQWCTLPFRGQPKQRRSPPSAKGTSKKQAHG
jgi:hypothetical protein